MISQNEIQFLPLGGCGEIGMNMSLYGYGGHWLMVDCGVTFGDSSTPGVELIVPDPHFIIQNNQKLTGIIITHAHEDHLGGLPYLWRQLKCPVYATPFAAGLLRKKLAEVGLSELVTIIEFSSGNQVNVDPFEISFIPVAHSVPETHCLAIKTGIGTIVHASDWKIDKEPLIGLPTDEACFREVGNTGVLALLCDSTNVFEDGFSGSEGALRQSMIEVISNCKGRVVVAFFASNVARMETCIRAAQENNRRIALVGRSLIRIAEIAKSCGYLSDCPEFIDVRDIGYLPQEEVLIMVTGSQGESRAALSRISNDNHPEISFTEGDTVIFSSREIPGNELSIGRLKNQLAKLNVHVIEENDAFVHVSGHPAREELKQLYDWINPSLMIPIHGETRHLIEHCRLAKKCGIPSALKVENGEVLSIRPDKAEIIKEVQSGRYAVDGRRLIPLKGDVMKSRRRLNLTGNALVTIVLDKHCELLKVPKISAPGIVDDMGQDVVMHSKAVSSIEKTIQLMSRKQKIDDEKINRVVSSSIRKIFHQETGKRPMVILHIVRV